MWQVLLMQGVLMHVLLMEPTPGLKKEKINVTFHVAGAAPWQLMAMQVWKLQHYFLVSRLHLDSKKKKNKRCFPCGRRCSVAINGCAGFEVAMEQLGKFRGASCSTFHVVRTCVHARTRSSCRPVGRDAVLL
jgi:hypothetical protein